MFSNRDDSLQEALSALKIDVNMLSRIHTIALKKDYLLYKYLCHELEQVSFALSVNMPVSTVKQFIFQGFNHYQTLLQSPFITRHRTLYSAGSVGLHELDTRTVVDRQKKNDFSNALVSVIHTDDKKSGVEPGFEAIQKQDVLLALYHAYPALDARLAVLAAEDGSLEKLYRRFQADLPTYLVKLTYHQKEGQTKVKPERNDVERTQSIQQLYEKSHLLGKLATRVYQESKAATPSEKNSEAIAEVLANDIARAYGLPVQDQVLYRQMHHNGAMKLTLKAAWLKGATTLQPLQGGKNNDHVKVIPAPVHLKGITALADPKMREFAEYLFLFLAQGDRDSIGSRGQNKLIHHQQLTGIDFGHAYQENIASKIEANFQVKDATFKNYSIFYDAPRSMQVRGLLRLARFAGKAIHETILQSYGAAFAASWHAIPPHADENIFADYCRKIQEIADDYKQQGILQKQNVIDCEQMLKKIHATKLVARKTRDEIITRFQDYLSLPCDSIDFIAQLEKWLEGKDNTSMRSPDGTVLLNHIRIIKPNNVVWKKLSYRAQRYSFQAELKNAAVNHVEHLQAQLKKFPDSLGVSFIQRDNRLEINFPEKSLANLVTVFSDANLALIHHPEDAQLKSHFETAHAIQTTIDELKKQLGLTIVLVLSEIGFYALSIAAPSDPILETLLKEHCLLTDENKCYSTVLSQETVPEALSRLAELPALYQNRLTLEATLKKHCTQINLSLEACAKTTASALPPYQVSRIGDQLQFKANQPVPILLQTTLNPIFSGKTVFTLEELPALTILLHQAQKCLTTLHLQIDFKLRELQAMLKNINTELGTNALAATFDWMNGTLCFSSPLTTAPRLIQLLDIHFDKTYGYTNLAALNLQLQRGINLYRQEVQSALLAEAEQQRLSAYRHAIEENFIASTAKLREQLSDDLLFTIQLAPYDDEKACYRLSLGTANDEFWMSTVKNELRRFGTDPNDLTLTMAELEELNALLPDLVARHEINKTTKAHELMLLTQQVLETLRTLCKQLNEQYLQPQGWLKNTLFHVNTYVQSKPTAGKITVALMDILDLSKPFEHEQADVLNRQLKERHQHVAALKEKDPKREEELQLLDSILKQLDTYLDLIPASSLAPKP